VVVVGIAGVVGVLVGLLAIGEGFEKTLTQTGNDRNLIVLQAGAHSEAASSLGRETLAIVSQAPQLRRDADDRAMISAELLVGASLRKNATGREHRAAGVGVASAGEDRCWQKVSIGIA
jgi:putative ABC transport system permease protein